MVDRPGFAPQFSIFLGKHIKGAVVVPDIDQLGIGGGIEVAEIERQQRVGLSIAQYLEEGVLILAHVQPNLHSVLHAVRFLTAPAHEPELTSAVTRW